MTFNFCLIHNIKHRLRKAHLQDPTAKLYLVLEQFSSLSFFQILQLKQYIQEWAQQNLWKTVFKKLEVIPSA